MRNLRHRGCRKTERVGENSAALVFTLATTFRSFLSFATQRVFTGNACWYVRRFNARYGWIGNVKSLFAGECKWLGGAGWKRFLSGWITVYKLVDAETRHSVDKTGKRYFKYE